MINTRYEGTLGNVHAVTKIVPQDIISCFAGTFFYKCHDIDMLQHALTFSLF